MKNVKDAKKYQVVTTVLFCIAASWAWAGSSDFLSNPLDTGAPAITLNGSPTVVTPVSTLYTDAGATASDSCEGSLSGSIAVGGDTVDTGTPGIYTMTFNVNDSAGNAAPEVTRIVYVTNGTLAVASIADVGIGEGVTSTLTAVASGGTEVYTYQWQIWNDTIPGWDPVLDGVFDAGVYAGSTTMTLSFEPFTALMEGLYRVEVSDGVDTVYEEVTVTHEETPGLPASGMAGMIVLMFIVSLLFAYHRNTEAQRRKLRIEEHFS